MQQNNIKVVRYTHRLTECVSHIGVAVLGEAPLVVNHPSMQSDSIRWPRSKKQNENLNRTKNSKKSCQIQPFFFTFLSLAIPWDTGSRFNKSSMLESSQQWCPSRVHSQAFWQKFGQKTKTSSNFGFLNISLWKALQRYPK